LKKAFFRFPGGENHEGLLCLPHKGEETIEKLKVFGFILCSNSLWRLTSQMNLYVEK
jgi:hypothetical protein